MITALDVSEYLLRGLSRPEDGDTISNLKLQKLLYYSQGVHLAKYNRPLFKDEIVHWPRGPVVIKVYEKYKQHGNQSLPIPEKVKNFSKFSKEHKDSIKITYDFYGQYSAWVLSQKTHQEAPWRDTEQGSSINQKLIKNFFRRELSQAGII